VNYQKEKEEALLDVLDSLSGWCHPSKHLLTDPGK
jgi:hypothetical protein